MILGNCLKKEYSCVKANGAIHYAEDKAIFHDTYNMICTGDSKASEKNREFTTLQNAKNLSTNNRKYYHYFLSPEEENIDFNTMSEILKKALDKYLPEAQVIISGHNDTGHNHLNFIINSVQLNGKMVQINNGLYNDMKIYIQETLAKEYGLKETKTPFHIAKENGERYHKKHEQKEQIINSELDKIMDKRGNNSEKSIIQEKVFNILSKEKPTSYEDFNKLCKDNGITLEKFNNKDNIEMLSFKTDNLKYGITHYKLGEYFKLENINNVIEKNKEKELNKAIEKPQEHTRQYTIQEEPQTKKKEDNIVIPETKETNIDSNDTIQQLLRDAEMRKEKEEAKELEKELEKLTDEKSKTYDKIWEDIESLDEKKLKRFTKGEYTKDDLKEKLNELFKANYSKDKKLNITTSIKEIGNFGKSIINLYRQLEQFARDNTNDYGRGGY